MVTRTEFPHRQTVKMGLGEAINRLVKINTILASGVANVPEDSIRERHMIVEALNQYQLDLAFDCNADGVPDSIEIFKQSAETSCCRILPFKSDRKRTPSRRATRKKP